MAFFMNNIYSVMNGLKIINSDNDYFLTIENLKGIVSIKITKDIFIALRDKPNDHTSLEIERKFLLKSIPDLNTCIASHDIEQFYLLNDGLEKSSVRIRKYDNLFFFTFKKGGGLSKVEIEFEISKENYFDFEKIIISKNIIKKTRFEYDLGSGLIAEIDFFSGKFKDYLVCEVEFLTEKDAHDFIPPEWFGEDVSGDKRYGNIYMAFSD